MPTSFPRAITAVWSNIRDVHFTGAPSVTSDIDLYT